MAAEGGGEGGEERAEAGRCCRGSERGDGGAWLWGGAGEGIGHRGGGVMVGRGRRGGSLPDRNRSRFYRACFASGRERGYRRGGGSAAVRGRYDAIDAVLRCGWAGEVLLEDLRDAGEGFDALSGLGAEDGGFDAGRGVGEGVAGCGGMGGGGGVVGRSGGHDGDGRVFGEFGDACRAGCGGLMKLMMGV